MNNRLSNNSIILDWIEFVKYWDSTEWKKLSGNKVRELIGKYISFPIPNNINNPVIGRKFYRDVKKVMKPFTQSEQLV